MHRLQSVGAWLIKTMMTEATSGLRPAPEPSSRSCAGVALHGVRYGDLWGLGRRRAPKMHSILCLNTWVEHNCGISTAR